MKRRLLDLAMAADAFAPFRFRNRERVPVLMYHSFDARNDYFASTAEVFARHLEYLTSRHTLVPLSRVAEHLAGGDSLPPRAAVVTIDDGYRDAYEVAFPVLRRFNAPATLFLVTEFTEGTMWLWHDKLRYAALRSPLERASVPVGAETVDVDLAGGANRCRAVSQMYDVFKQLPEGAKPEALGRAASALRVDVPASPPEEFQPVTWDQAREMARHGVEIGSHTRTHPSLPSVDPERLRDELASSREHLEAELGRPVSTFAYPGGDHDGTVREATRSTGYTIAVGTDPGLNDRAADPMALRRLPSDRRVARVAQSTSGLEEARLRFRRRRSDA